MQSASRRPVTNGDLDHAPRANVHTLDNGLQVVLLEDHSAPVVALQTWVRFGSADEDPAVAGIAHVFEHMLFKGTDRFPNGEIAALIEGAGGSVNAWTNYDETVYHVTLSSRFWETGFDVLSDAILHSFFDPTELEREKEVVLEEFRRSKDNPDHEIAERLFDLTFTTHPYRRPIIGFEETVRPIQRDDMLRVFNTWYVPNNIIFVAVGDFDSDTMLRTVEDRFGAVPATALPVRPRADEPAQAQPRVLAFPFRAELARVEIAMPSVEATDPQVPALDLLGDLLGSGYNSTLYTALKRRRQLAHDVYAYNYTPCDRGVFLLGATCMTNDVADVVQGLMQPVRQPALSISEHDLAAAKTRIVSQYVHARETYQGIASQLGSHMLVYGDPNYGERYVAAIESLSHDDLQQAATTFLNPQRANLALLMPSDADLPSRDTMLAWTRHDDTPQAPALPRSPALNSDRGTDNTSVVSLPGGSTLIVQTDRKAPLVTIRTLLAGGQRSAPQGKEGIVRLLSATWDRGTSMRSASEIERELDRLGATLGASSDRDSVQLAARFLRDTFADGLELYLELLTEPSFPDVEVAREQADQLRDLDTLKENRFQYAMQQFLRKFYGSHPYNHLSIGTPEGLSTVSRDDLAAFHQSLLRPQNAVYVVVGDITADTVLSRWRQLAPASLSESAAAVTPTVPEVPTWSEAVTEVIDVEGQQTHVIWGFPTVTGRDPNRYTLQVLDTILGGMGGRLFVELRDKRGLAYAVTSFDAYPVDPGYLAFYIGCTPEKEDEALSEFERVVQEIQSDGVTSEELERAKTYIAGALDISLQSTSQRTSIFGLGMLYQGQWNAYQTYLEAVQKVSLSDIQEAARTYLQPSRSLRTILRAQR
jgi:zinc protease